MRVAGIDVSSWSIDIVTIPLDEALEGTEHGEASGITTRLSGATPIERACDATGRVPRGTFWDDIAEVAIERPYGPGPDALFAMHLMIGLVLGAMPERLHPPLFLQPSSWRKHAGLSGRATKPEVFAFAAERMPHRPRSQDVADAYCIARAARKLNVDRLERAA